MSVTIEMPVPSTQQVNELIPNLWKQLEDLSGSKRLTIKCRNSEGRTIVYCTDEEGNVGESEYFHHEWRMRSQDGRDLLVLETIQIAAWKVIHPESEENEEEI